MLGALPPAWPNVPLDVLFELIDTKMPSIDSCESFVKAKALAKLVAKQLSKKLAGNSVSPEQFCHACWKLVPLLTSRDGNDVKPEQFCHA